MRSPGMDRKEAAKSLHLLGSFAQGGLFSKRGRETFLHSLHSWLPALALPVSAAPTQKAVPVLRRIQFLKLRLGKTGMWGPHRFLTLIPDLPFPLPQEGEDSNTQTKYQKKKREPGVNSSCPWDLYSNRLMAKRNPY